MRNWKATKALAGDSPLLGKSSPVCAAASLTATTADAALLPPLPWQVSVNVLDAASSAPVLAEPEVGRLPLHAPDAVQLVAFVEFQVSELLPPLETLVGLADRFTTGAAGGGGVTAATVTTASALPVPPVPLHANAKVFRAAVSAPVLAVPDVPRVPLHAPDAVQLVAFADDQVSVELPPLETLVGVAAMLTVGAAAAACVTVTTVEALAEPPAPLHSRLNVLDAALSAPVLAVPDTGRLPLQAPEAVQDEAFVEDQASVDDSDCLIDAGEALRFTVGLGVLLETAMATEACRLETKLRQVNVYD